MRKSVSPRVLSSSIAHTRAVFKVAIQTRLRAVLGFVIDDGPFRRGGYHAGRIATVCPSLTVISPASLSSFLGSPRRRPKRFGSHSRPTSARHRRSSSPCPAWYPGHTVAMRRYGQWRRGVVFESSLIRKNATEDFRSLPFDFFLFRSNIRHHVVDNVHTRYTWVSRASLWKRDTLSPMPIALPPVSSYRLPLSSEPLDRFRQCSSPRFRPSLARI
jgi:hypothetical protein